MFGLGPYKRKQDSQARYYKVTTVQGLGLGKERCAFRPGYSQLRDRQLHRGARAYLNIRDHKGLLQMFRV